MINIKKTFLLSIIVSISTLFFAGCGTPKVPDIDQMSKDLVAINAANFDIRYQYDSSVKTESFDVSSIELVKRKTDDESGVDTAYISAILDNEYYTVNADYTLTYNLYDEGGWILDEYEVTDYSIDAKANPLPVEEINFTRLALRGGFHEADFINNETGITEDGYFYNTLSFEGTHGYAGMTLYTTGTYDFIFKNGVWYENYRIDSMQYDLSPMLRSWTWNSDKNDDYISLTIHDLRIISDYRAEITYEYSSYTDKTYIHAPDYTTSERIANISTETISYDDKNITVFEDTYSIPSTFSFNVVLGQSNDPMTVDTHDYYNIAYLELNTVNGVVIDHVRDYEYSGDVFY